MFDGLFRKLNFSVDGVTVAKNISWAVIGKVVTLLGGFIVGVFVARYLGPEQYGLMSYVISFVAIFQALANFGLDNIEIREEAKNRDERDAIIGTAFVLKLIFAVVTILLIAIIVNFSETDVFTRWMILLYSLSIICNSFFVARNYFTAIVWNEYVVKSEISRTVIGIVIKVVLLLLHSNLVWFIAACMFDYVLLAAGYCLSYSKKIAPIRLWRFERKWARFLVKQSFPLMLTSAAVIIYQRIDQLMIKNMLDDASLGQFSVANRFVEVLVFVPVMICQTVAPVLVSKRREDEVAYKNMSQFFMNIVVWISIVISLITSLLSYFIVVWTFGEVYIPAVSVLQILAFKTVTVALSNTAGQLLIIEGLQNYAVIRDILGCVVCVVLNYLLIPTLGVIGSAIVTILSNFVAGYVSDIIIPKYRHLFRMQTKAIFLGWKSMLRFSKIR